MDKLPIIAKLRKRYSIYEKIDGEIRYINIPDEIGKDFYPKVLYDFGKNKVVTVECWKDMYDLSMKG